MSALVFNSTNNNLFTSLLHVVVDVVASDVRSSLNNIEVYGIVVSTRVSECTES